MEDSDLVQFKLLLPAALKARVETHASTNRRSLSQEIVTTLEEKYPAPMTPEAMVDLAESFVERLRQMPQDKEWAEASRAVIDLIETIKKQLAD